MFFESLLATFGLVFVAELGDKTQLATMLLATQQKSLLGVFLGASLALILASLLGVLLGDFLTKFFPPHILKNLAGIGFIFMGVFLLFFQK